MQDLLDALARAPVVALLQPARPEQAVETARALVDGGLSVIEIVLRTSSALASVQAVSREVPGALIGVGTVLDADQVRQSVDGGARFIVSPGLGPAVVDASHAAGLPVIPGISTPTELQQARDLGLRLVKFFPAELSGGVAMLRSLGEVFPDMRFMPTGGVHAGNLAGYLELGCVVACGGTWMTSPAVLESEGYAGVTRLAREAVDIAREARKHA
ncbi:MAG: bifunctional 4-hydroxy-2-oxoglutarate aldolase/2-dehydro-3-deoxy-phosphogluconate aldolase [Xanthomonadales bacterium]|nr:bifunctional 4-hydroxy-2-oxoglutarate aldolase/2-dehydro-3-deoxy-phosphogluconate aldolase [Xanthomonadales bacterium]